MYNAYSRQLFFFVSLTCTFLGYIVSTEPNGNNCVYDSTQLSSEVMTGEQETSFSASNTEHSLYQENSIDSQDSTVPAQVDIFFYQ